MMDGQPASGHGYAVTSEISTRVQMMRAAARQRGGALRPPLLLLGTSERVGSNWISDTLRPVLGQHNEPFRQQLGAAHPLSPLNPDLASLIGGAELSNLGRHWLVSFAAAKYATCRQVVKETNLFFGLPGFLALFPDAPVLVLSRSPLGVASSFIRGGLFSRWGYAARYRQMITMTRGAHGERRRFAALVPDDRPSDLIALARLLALNTVLLAEALAGRDVGHIPYETAVIAPDVALAALAVAVPELEARELLLDQGAQNPEVASTVEDTFATTTAKTGLVAHLDPAQAEQVRAATAASLAAAQDITTAAALAQAAAWLAGDHLYRLEPLPPRPAAAGPVAARPAWPHYAPATTPRYVRRGGLDVRNLLVSNAEYAAFLNALAQAGMPNCHDGTWLLACEMPHERGGRLHHEPATGHWHVSPGYEQHPAYWVTWIGAAAFAARESARLPTRAELIRLTSQTTGASSNAAYRDGDVTAVTEPSRGDSEIHHLAGNLQTWCADGPSASQLDGGPAARWLFGAAWNTPATAAEMQRPRHRHLLGCSRGVGIRLVRDGSQVPAGASELAARLAAWITALEDRSQPLAELDERVIGALGGSQANAGFGPHVAPGAREPGHG
jgi:formylglycine-generating enzyme required for sulfatase activity